MRSESTSEPEGSPGGDELRQARPPTRRWGVWVVLALLVGFYIYASRPVPAAFAWERDYETGLRRAAQQGQFVLLEFQTAGCPACDWMDREVFSETDVAQALEGWVPIRIDGNRNPKLATQYNIEAFPSFRVLSPDGKLVTGFTGARSADEFIRFLQQARAQGIQHAG